MNGITHKQAQKYVRLDLDGLLTDDQHRDLETHLSGCEACRLEARAFSTLTSRLQSGFRSRWDAQDGPSKNVMATVRSQTRRIIMSNRIGLGIKALGGIAAVLVFGFLINLVVSQMREYSVAANGTESNIPISSSERLIAFVSEENGNPDIYTMYPDGSGLTNLTNNPANDINPYWSPDGKRIAFQRDDPLGLMQIFVMNADGSNVIQLTNNEVNHELMSLHGPWSPDGNRLLFTEWGEPDSEKWILSTIDLDGQNKTPIAEVPNQYTSPSWSPDGQQVSFIKLKPQDGPQEREVSRIYVVDSDGQNLVEVTKLVPADEDLSSWNYSWSSDGQSILFVGERYYWENGNGRSALYQVSLDGNSLVEVDHVTTHMDDWWNGTALILPYASSRPYTWLRPDGTHNLLNPYKNCSPSDALHGLNHKRSINGDLIIGAGCANDDWWFHWANPDGTVIQQLLNYPIRVKDGSVDIFWSPDDKYVVLSAISSDITSLYVLNVPDALKDPSVQPVKVDVAGDAQYYNISWQPVP